MKRNLIFAACIIVSAMMNAQEVDHFQIGPYDVNYNLDNGDYSSKLRDDIDLYDFYDLKKDTVVNEIVEPKPIPFINGIQVGAFFETCLYNTSRYSSVFGVEGAWKQNISYNLYVNGGASLGFASSTIGITKYNVLELGIPLSVEYGSIDRKYASLYGSIGVTPTFYSTMSAKYEPKLTFEPEKYSGLYIAPRVEFGGYVPVNTTLVRLGVYFKYKINCSSKDVDLYHDLLGRTFFGVNVGVVF